MHPLINVNRSRLVAKPPSDAPTRMPAYFYVPSAEGIQGLVFGDVIMLAGFWWRQDAQEIFEMLRTRVRRDA